MTQNKRPNSIETSKPNKLRLGIKSSNGDVKSSFALLYCLWKSNGCPANLEYAKEVQEGNNIKIKLDDKVKENLYEFFSKQISTQTGGLIHLVDKAKIEENQLLKNQIEPLLVTFEEIYQIARFKFVDSTKNITSERSGGNRYKKSIIYSSNIDYIDLIIDGNLEEYKNILFKWIVNEDIKETEKHLENRLIKAMTLISESAIYKIKQSNGEGIIFRNEGIYKQFDTGQEEVWIDDEIEKRGSLRILPTILKQSLNYFLDIKNNYVKLKENIDIENIKQYRKRVDEFIKISNVKIDDNSLSTDEETGNNEISIDSINKPHNRIIFGAPGTGKSYTIDKEREVFKDSYERVTFHPNYSYSQFVGSYKPISKEREVESLNQNKKEEFITYEFVPGPFTRVLIKSLIDRKSPNLLIIEEINRANTAGVFGDVFQLLDRDKNGLSKYTIDISEEMKKYINIQLENEGIAKINELYIPENMYIWTTMNSADQGVYPMDSAFKRRWSFEYLHIDSGETELESKDYNIIKLKNESGYKKYKWNDVRKAINENLENLSTRVNEDKLLGPFFLSESELKLSQMDNKQKEFDNIFKSKVLMYLFEDVLKHKKTDFFKDGIESFSKLVKAYDKGNVFNFDINEYIEKNENQDTETDKLETSTN